jgi:hypothetical protein
VVVGAVVTVGAGRTTAGVDWPGWGTPAGDVGTALGSTVLVGPGTGVVVVVAEAAGVDESVGWSVGVPVAGWLAWRWCLHGGPAFDAQWNQAVYEP